jgi:hypothetical protein
MFDLFVLGFGCVNVFNILLIGAVIVFGYWAENGIMLGG